MGEISFDPDPVVYRLITGHFHAEPGYRTVRPNGSTSWLVMLTLGGTGVVNGETFGPMQLVAIRPATPQDYGTSGPDPWNFIWVHFHPWPHWTNWLGTQGIQFCDIRFHGDQFHIVDRFHAVHRYAMNHAPLHEAHAMNALEDLLLHSVALAQQKAIDPRIQRACEFLATHLSRGISVSEVAAREGLSVSRMTHLFRQEMGVSIGFYLETLRLDRARGLLELTDQSVTWISEECGFESVYYFSLRFKKKTGLSPTAYRQAVQKGR